MKDDLPTVMGCDSFVNRSRSGSWGLAEFDKCMGLSIASLIGLDTDSEAWRISA